MAGPQTAGLVDRRDLSLFEYIDDAGGTSDVDLRSLLAIHAVVASRGNFSYLEVGAYLGRSLQALVADPRCIAITVIDRRDELSPDVRDEGPLYPDNSTANMLAHLSRVPSADLSKVRSLDTTTHELDGASFHADLCFIDAQHTDDAALQDARFCRLATRNQGVIVFHDRTLVDRGIRRFLAELSNYRAYPLSHELFVVELGIPTLLSDQRVEEMVPRRAWLMIARLHAVRQALWLTAVARR